MTKDEAKAKFLPRLTAKRKTEATWGDIVSSVQSASTAQKSGIVDAYRQNSSAQIGHALQIIVDAYVAAQAEVEMNAILDDDAIDLAEIDRLV